MTRFPWRCVCLVGIRGSARTRSCERVARGRVEIIGLMTSMMVDTCRTHYLALKKKFVKVRIVRRYPLPKTSLKQLHLPRKVGVQAKNQ